MKSRLYGTTDECREALELLDSALLIQSVHGPYQDRQRGELVRIYIDAIPRGGR